MLAGYFDADFWSHFLPQFSHHKPAIWHSVLALSAFHEQRLLREDRPMQKVDLVHQRYALLQYNQAISLLRGQGSTSKVPTEVVLAGCVLFVAIESVMGNLLGVVSHMSGGIQIARLWEKEKAKPGIITLKFKVHRKQSHSHFRTLEPIHIYSWPSWTANLGSGIGLG
jgi:hypothetical protein